MFGAAGGIGAAFVRALLDDPHCATVFGGARRPLEPAQRFQPFHFDLQDESTIAAAFQTMANGGPVDLVIVATGMLHDGAVKPEKTIRNLDAEALTRSFAINTIGPALIAKHALAQLPRDRKAVFAALSARVGSISDNHSGGWYAYRAAKAALNQMIRTAAIECAAKNKHAVCVALHPGTVDTAMSKPFQAGVAAEKLFTPDYSAHRLLSVIDALTPADSGGFFAWDGAPIAY